jgi:hypothetical protein
MSDPVQTDGNGQQLGTLLAVVGWIGAGAISLAALMLTLDLVFDLPLSRSVAVGLGLALGGGIGGVANLLRGGDRVETEDETMTVDVATQATTEPQPADLFDGHPDPVLYYAAAGHGPVVRAANDAFAETFDVPADQLAGTPLSETLLVAGEETVSAEAVLAGDVDTVVDCTVPEGIARFRLRTVGSDDTGYLLYTPVETAD